METILSKEVNYNCDEKWNIMLNHMLNLIEKKSFMNICLNVGNVITNINYQKTFTNELSNEIYYIFTTSHNICYILNLIDINQIYFDQYHSLNIIATKVIKKELTRIKVKEKMFLTIEDKNYIFNSNDVQKDLPF